MSRPSPEDTIARGCSGGAVLAGALGGVLLLAAPARALIGAGLLDPTFGAGGVAITPFGQGTAAARAVVVQPDRKIVIAGSVHNGTDLDVLLARYDTAGALDPTFGTGGIVVTSVGPGDEVAEAMVRAPDGSFLVAGRVPDGAVTAVLLLRYLPNGTPDPTFGTGGVVRSSVPGGGEALALVREPNGRIGIGGRAAGGLLLAHYDRDGTPDTSFGPEGVTVTPAGGPAAATAIVRIGSGRFLVGGWVRVGADADVIFARYAANGALHTAFGTGGLLIVSLGSGDDAVEAMVERRNRLVAAGWSDDGGGSDVVLLRLNANTGTLEGFGNGGVVRTPLGTPSRALALALDERDDLVVAGLASAPSGTAFALLRYGGGTGVLDPSYGTGGVAITPIGPAAAAAEAVAVLHDGRAVAAGHASNGGDDDVALVRHLGTPRCGNDLLEPELGEVCDGGNRSHGDCCGPACQLDAAATACADDGDPCTEDRCDGAGTCVHSPVAGACDAHLCYTAPSLLPTAPVPIAVANVFESGTGTARSPRALCPAAGVDGAGIDDTTVHHQTYGLSVPRRPQRQDLRIADRFGTLRLRLSRPERLLLPAAVAVDAPAGGPPPAGVDDAYECYRAGITPGTPGLPAGTQVEVTDAFETRRYDVRRPRRLCVPTDVNGSGVVRPRGHLLCYEVRAAAGEPRHTRITGRLHTATGLGATRVDTRREDELCVPALREPCGVLPPCTLGSGQAPECRYDPAVTDPTHPFCQGPKVMVDATHENFHVLGDTAAGGYWGFARLLLNDGYDLQHSTEPVTTLLRTAEGIVLVIANPTTTAGFDAQAVIAREARAIADWVVAGGALLLVIDHSPYEQVGALLGLLGLERVPQGDVSQLVFERTEGTLNGAAAVANGPGPDTAIDQVTTFTGTVFSLAARPPAGAIYEPVLTLPPGTTGDFGADLGGFHQAVAIELGAGRVYVSAEAGGLTAQTTFGMHETPDNERYLRNILWWLTR